MLPPRCFTCGGMLAHLEVPFEAARKNICDNPNLKDEEKIELLTKNINDLGLIRYCCKLRVITYIDTIDLIK
jgi:DNA-directed RNA polymerase subunit N (RpoN/RPB10)